jgi:hypothetical protein
VEDKGRQILGNLCAQFKAMDFKRKHGYFPHTIFLIESRYETPEGKRLFSLGSRYTKN